MMHGNVEIVEVLITEEGVIDNVPLATGVMKRIMIPFSGKI